MSKRKIRPTINSVLLPLCAFLVILLLTRKNHLWGDTSHSMSDLDSMVDSKYFEDFSKNDKQKGAHVFGILDSISLLPFHEDNIEWISMVPWGFQTDYNGSKVGHHNGDPIMIRQSDSSWVARINRVKKAGFKVFVKPHVWINDASEGMWRSDIYPDNDENWREWRISYKEFIIRYATIAEKAEAEMFCVGVEFTRLALEKPEFWESLIKEVRKVYSGKLTYAANWYKEYEKVSFWNDLDFIGIQAYFPLTDEVAPDVSQLSQGWDKYLPKLEAVSKKNARQILFTEIGYKSTTDSAHEPWVWLENTEADTKSFSEETQANCYSAFFSQVWTKNWFAGAYIWQMRTDHKERYKERNKDFTPQSKKGARIIREGYRD